MIARPLAAAAVLALGLTGCASQDPAEELRSDVRALTLAANDGDGDAVRDAVDDLLATVRAQVASQELAVDKGQRISALAQAVAAEADTIDRDLIEQRERAEAEASASAEAERRRQQQEQEQEQRERLEEQQRQQEEERQRLEEERRKAEEEERKRQEKEQKEREEQEEQEGIEILPSPDSSPATQPRPTDPATPTPAPA